MSANTVAVSSSSMTPSQLKSLPRGRKVELLRELRTRPSRNPTTVALLAADVLAGGGSGLGDESYTVWEQYFIACLELRNHQQAAACLQHLVKRFGQPSTRVRKLYGLLAESAGEKDKAKQIYESILKDSPADAFVVKRFSAMCKAEGRYQDAVDALESVAHYTDEDSKKHTYLSLHNVDENTFRELINLHYYLGKWERCVYYAEEAILVNPHSYLNHIRHAEMCFAAKLFERSATAYAHALTLNESPNNSRAAFGLLAVTKELLAIGRSNSKREGATSSSALVATEDVKPLRQWAAQRLRALYRGTAAAGALDLMMQSEGI